MWEAAYKFIYEHPYQFDLTYSRIKYPDNGLLEDMMLEYPTNIRISEDTLLFDAVVSCTVTLTVDGYRGMETAETNQWLVISCEALVKDKLEKLTITEIKNYKMGKQRKNAGQAVSKNIVPILYKSDLDKEAEVFLARYYPEALEKPTPVPIDTIAEDMGLEIIQGHRITDDFSVFGQICFSDRTADVFDIFKCNKSTIDVKRGTILIDAYTFWERNLGCVNNTIAHEAFHWYKHRMYASINTAYIEIPKKQEKSELAAAVALLLTCGDGEERAEVYGCAADRQQASIVFEVAADMVRMCPALNKRVKILASQKRIIYQPTNSFYQVLSAEAYSKHGFNIHGAVFDELHTQPNRKLFDVMTKGSGDARTQPLYFLITTAGTDTNFICYETHQKAKDIIEGRKNDPTFYPVIYGANEEDDWTDPKW